LLTNKENCALKLVVEIVIPHIFISAVGGRKGVVGGRFARWERAPILADRSNQKCTVPFVENSHAHSRIQNPISFSSNPYPSHYKRLKCPSPGSGIDRLNSVIISVCLGWGGAHTYQSDNHRSVSLLVQESR